jgi:hypothetical protein
MEGAPGDHLPSREGAALPNKRPKAGKSRIKFARGWRKSRPIGVLPSMSMLLRLATTPPESQNALLHGYFHGPPHNSLVLRTGQPPPPP